MAAIDLIIKLGGAAITHKRAPALPETLNEGALAATADALAAAWRAGLVFVVVHGAGSFGHSLAKQYALTTGGTEGMDKLARVWHCFARLFA